MRLCDHSSSGKGRIVGVGGVDALRNRGGRDDARFDRLGGRGYLLAEGGTGEVLKTDASKPRRGGVVVAKGGGGTDNLPSQSLSINLAYVKALLTRLAQQ